MSRHQNSFVGDYGGASDDVIVYSVILTNGFAGCLSCLMIAEAGVVISHVGVRRMSRCWYHGITQPRCVRRELVSSVGTDTVSIASRNRDRYKVNGFLPLVFIISIQSHPSSAIQPCQPSTPHIAHTISVLHTSNPPTFLSYQSSIKPTNQANNKQHIPPTHPKCQQYHDPTSPPSPPS